MKFELSQEELELVFEHRAEQLYKKQSESIKPKNKEARKCKHIGFEMEGSYCKINKGSWFNHCWLSNNNDCPYYEEKEKL